MQTLQLLGDRLRALDGRGYKAYRAIKGAYDAGRYRLLVDRVQGDPFAEPSRLRALVPAGEAGFPDWALASPARRAAAADFVNRALYGALSAASTRDGSGRSGEFRVLRPGQEVLDRTSVIVRPDGGLEARFRAGLPARGRRILGRTAAELLTRALPAALERSLFAESLDGAALRRQVEVVEDARALRAALEPRGLVAFVADGAHLPRRSGVDDRPLPFERAVPFGSPGRLRVTLEAPNGGAISGMGVPRGITLIVGGGYHGKSTVLRAIERGVYDHVPGDGRERVVAVAGAVKVRAENGRSIGGTDISNFIGRLPGGGDTRRFVTANASGSTSQAAAMVEALEAGATCLLLDEDTSATNLLIRDARMQALVPDEREPITPYIDRAGRLAAELGVSSILVLGGSGDYLDIADTVIALQDYVPEDVTAAAREVTARLPSQRRTAASEWRPVAARAPLPASLDAAHRRRDVHIKVLARDRVVYGAQDVELAAVEQLVERAQTRAIADAIAWARGDIIDGRRPLAAVLDAIEAAIARDGLDLVQPQPAGELAAFRRFELAAFLNRIRSLETVSAG